MKFAIEHCDTAYFTKAMPLAFAAMDELERAGIAEAALPLNWDHRVIIALEGDDALGFMAWLKVDHRKEAFVTLGYVRPEHRRRGVYRALWEALVQKAEELGLHHICGATHIDNCAMRAVAERLGRKEYSVQYYYELPCRLVTPAAS